MRDASASPTPPEAFSLRSLIGPVYAPTVLYAVGQGLVIPVIPLFAQDLGAGLGLVGLIVAMRGVGSMLFDIPAGVLMDRFGGRATMAAGMAGTALLAVGMGFSVNVPMYTLLIFLSGGAMSIWMVSRLTYVAEATPIEQRGRAISLVGGTNRMGVFIGPVVGGLIGSQYGLGAVFFAQAAVVGASSLFILSRPATAPARSARPEGASGRRAHSRIGRTFLDQRRDILTVGTVAITLVLMRQARQVIVPLWGDAIGLDVAAIGLVYTLASAVDALLFYPVGVVMDRWGRKWAVVPSLLMLAVSLVAIPLTRDFTSFLVMGIVSGIGNGMGSGVVMTLGADLAPRERAGEFIGVWRLVTDAGTALAPIVVGVIAQALTLGVAAVASGGIGLAGAAVMVFAVTETLQRSDAVHPRAPS